MLEPGTGADPVVCRLVSTHLSDAVKQYEATSYTWGSPEDPEIIDCDGIALKIQKNAFHMLLDLRLTDRTRSLWIDAICINQNDSKERGEQVSFMHAIYASAKAVVIYLGIPDRHSVIAMKFAASLDYAKYMREVKDTWGMGRKGESMWRRKTYIFNPDTDVGLQVSEETATALVEFLSRPWFTRVWVQQEATASLFTQVVCGRDTVEWNQLFALAWIFLPGYTSKWPEYLPYTLASVQSKANAVNGMHVARVRVFRDEHDNIANGHNGLAYLLRDAHMYESTDPCDKIFALYNRCIDTSDPSRPKNVYPRWGPKVDYDLPWEKLFLDVSQQLLVHGKVAFLSMSGRARQPKDWVLPSWVVDFRARPSSMSGSENDLVQHDEWVAGGPHYFNSITDLPVQELAAKLVPFPKAHRPRIDPSMLSEQYRVRKKGGRSPLAVWNYVSLRSLMADEIMYTGGVMCDLPDHESISNTFKPHLAFARASLEYVSSLPEQTYINGDSALDAYKLTLIAATDHQEQLVGAEYAQAHWDESFRWLEIEGYEDEVGKPKRDLPLFTQALLIAGNWDRFRFAMTRHGYFCLVPAMARVGDTVAIIKGHRTPVVLRPWEPPATAATETAYFEHLGDAYVHGMMDNQAGCICDEFGCKAAMTEAQRDKVLQAARKNDGEEWRVLGFGDYTRVLPTLGTGWVNLV